MKRIAHIAVRRKEHAADLIEEFMYDDELRFNDGGRESRPMHLQTADMRMPVYKARNWDLYAVSALGASVILESTWFIGRLVWISRGSLVEGLRGVFKMQGTPSPKRCI